MFIDTHAHIYLDAFENDLDAVMDRALAAGIDEIYLPNIDASSIDDVHRLVAAYPGRCFPMMGLHPCSVTENYEEVLRQVEAQLEKGGYLAVGEMGTDLYWDKRHWEEQKKAFHRQCELALHHQLPVVVHCRNSIDETIDLIREWALKGLTGVFHCFTGSIDQGAEITDLGFYLGLGGVITFKKGGMDVVVPHLDRSRVVLETDSPYLTPTPYRGKRNEPAYTRLVAGEVAKSWGVGLDEVAEITTRNARQLFKSYEL